MSEIPSKALRQALIETGLAAVIEADAEAETRRTAAPSVEVPSVIIIFLTTKNLNAVGV